MTNNTHPSPAPDYASWFRATSGHPRPHEWQCRLASDYACRSRLVRIPTGLGKTLGVLSVWLYHRVLRGDEIWPRRLVWTLPMRVLVEQTVAVAQDVLAQADLLWDGKPDTHGGKVGVHLLMGGEEAGEWRLHPEKSAILVGTQDMLLSRALNRGYGSSRARWPTEYGLITSDALWVFDEVQLMDVGLATSAQLQAFRDEEVDRQLRPCHSWWMSATLQPSWLRSVDTEAHHEAWCMDPTEVSAEHRSGGAWEANRFLARDPIPAKDAEEFAARVLAEHEQAPAESHGKITLVVCNTVDRAVETVDALHASGRKRGVELVHGRFRPAERESWRERFLCREACTSNADRIIVATQVVEAGVDISAGRLVTELAPWPSLVQRFGRCARYGGEGRVVVVDRGREEKEAAPYAVSELNAAWGALAELPDLRIDTLEDFERGLAPERRATLYPYEPEHLLLRREADELFDTTPDLTGADLDISRFIRSGEERDVLIFWRDVDAQGPPPTVQPQRRELCSVPFLRASEWLCGKDSKTSPKPKLKDGMRAWVWDWLDGAWVVATRALLRPGRVVCVEASCGGYLPERGFSPKSKQVVAPVSAAVKPPAAVQALAAAEASQNGENLSFSEWKTISCHSCEAASEVQRLAEALGLPDAICEALRLAALWHDVGKSHPAFQGAIRADDRPERQDLAKAPGRAWLSAPNAYRFAGGRETRPGFRHEMGSALALFAVLAKFAPYHPALLGPWRDVFGSTQEASVPDSTLPPEVDAILGCSASDFDLIAYLSASHHGKVRVALHAAPADQAYIDRDGRGLPIRGLRDGDRLPPLAFGHDAPLSELTLSLEPASLGLSPQTGASWRERCIGLLERFGPRSLAFLEAILRAADVRASRLTTTDPALSPEVAP